MNETFPLLFNPADYFTFVLDQEIRKAGLPGGYGGFALELAAAPDLNQLQQRLDLLVERFPRASARIERQGKRFAWVATGRRIVLECHHCCQGKAAEGEPQRILLEIVNRQESLPLTLHWIAGETGGTLLLVWNHPLLDARGAKILLDFIASDHPEGFKESPPLIEAKLAQWNFWKKLHLFLKAKRHNSEANSLDSCLPTLAEQGPQVLRLKVRRFGEEESQRIARLAQQYTGLAGRTLYYLGCFMRAMEQVGPPAAKAGYCIPYAFNLRRQNAPTPVFGNHVGCLFARATRTQTLERKGLFGHLLAQHRKTLREELDLAYLPLMWLGQWLSPDRYAKLLRKQRSGGELSSLWFSDIGDLSWGNKGFLGAPVTGMTHLCWMTLPPGLALLAGQLDGRLSLSYSYLHPAVDEAWLDAAMERMDAELLEITGA
ncbi:MAG: hypothetical protein DM484_14920 [Candidatus Methylumidiphilus alinenensis]|uniref:Condensation domain-containing protein n=1 Tax=Candidatus Methylumidiphilus alinenensis TaxID=2202197 RepID=A0A2W4R2N0_9GAMM|nr:MAG: hypothetical protein DM484_14920 [Candidatus Methylumidiphilus alinenensis]